MRHSNLCRIGLKYKLKRITNYLTQLHLSKVKVVCAESESEH